MAKDRNTPSIFSTRPEPRDVSIRYRIVRCGPKAPLRATILSTELVGCYTHYWHGRTLPCCPQSCPACDESQPRRWHGYLAITGKDQLDLEILEITAAASAAFAAYLDRFPTLRGAQLRLQRVGAKANGRLDSTLWPPTESTNSLPTEPDVEAILLAMWEASWATKGLKVPADITAAEHKKHSPSTDEINGPTTIAAVLARNGRR